MKLKIKILDDQPEEVKQFLLKYYTGVINNINSKKNNNKFTDSGIDLVIPYDIICKYGETTAINHGIACQPDTLQGYYLYPRSSLSSTPLRLANSVGIIDSGYTGPIIAKVDNWKPYASSGLTTAIFTFVRNFFSKLTNIVKENTDTDILVSDEFTTLYSKNDYKISVVDNDGVDTYYKVVRLFQLCSPDLSPLEIELVDTLEETERGANGFGSTN
jgi:dUTPase